MAPSTLLLSFLRDVTTVKQDILDAHKHSSRFGREEYNPKVIWYATDHRAQKCLKLLVYSTGTDSNDEPTLLGPLRAEQGAVPEKNPTSKSRVVPDSEGQSSSDDRPIRKRPGE